MLMHMLLLPIMGILLPLLELMFLLMIISMNMRTGMLIPIL